MYNTQYNVMYNTPTLYARLFILLRFFVQVFFWGYERMFFTIQLHLIPLCKSVQNETTHSKTAGLAGAWSDWLGMLADGTQLPSEQG